MYIITLQFIGYGSAASNPACPMVYHALLQLNHDHVSTLFYIHVSNTGLNISFQVFLNNFEISLKDCTFIIKKLFCFSSERQTTSPVLMTFPRYLQSNLKMMSMVEMKISFYNSSEHFIENNWRAFFVQPYVQTPQVWVWAHYISTLVLMLPDHYDFTGRS